MFLESERLTIGHEYCAVRNLHLIGWQHALRRAVIAFLPSEQSMGRIIDHHIFIFYRQEHGVDIHRQQPLVAADILHLQVSGHIPATYGRMIADDGQRLPFLELRSRHTEENGLAVKRDTQGFDLFVSGAQHSRQIGIGIEMILERNLTPLVSHHVILGGIEVITTWNHRPLTTQHTFLSILHLIIIGERGDGMMARLKGRGLQFPMPAIRGCHHQAIEFLSPVITPVSDTHIEVFTPLSAILDCKLQFHKQ